jgi:hypothetical protein
MRAMTAVNTATIDCSNFSHKAIASAIRYAIL